MSRRPKNTASRKRLRAALTKKTKTELVEWLCDAAAAHREVRQGLEADLGIVLPVRELVRDTERAILEATAFELGEEGHNFDYDWEAYKRVETNFSKLMAKGKLKQVMDLALSLMKQGSYQVECSDEGLMSSDIEHCLAPVIKAVGRSTLPATSIRSWCDSLSKADRVQCHCYSEINALREKHS